MWGARRGCVFADALVESRTKSTFKKGSGFRVQGAGCRVQGSRFRVQGSGFRELGCPPLEVERKSLPGRYDPDNGSAMFIGASRHHPQNCLVPPPKMDRAAKPTVLLRRSFQFFSGY